MRVTFAAGGNRVDLARRAIGAIYFLLLFAGSAAVGYAIDYWVNLYEFQRAEVAAFNVPAINIVTPSPPAETLLLSGDLIGEIEVPRLEMKAMIVQGDSETELRHAVGHIPETALPGRSGNVALAAHRDGLFRPLRKVQPGDQIYVQTRERRFAYQVEWTRVVAPTATEVIEPTQERSLTLVTCFPFYYAGSAPKRFIVRAREIPEVSDPPGML